MLLLRDLFAVFVLAKTSAAARVVDFKFDPSLQMPPLPDKFETYTVHTCLKSLENDPNVAFSADQVLSNEEDFPWASQGWSKVSRVWPQGVVEVFNASQKRIGGGLGGLGPDGAFVMATKEQMNASLKTLRRLIACCRRTNTLFTMRSGGHCNAGCSSMGGTMTFGIKGLNIVAPKDVAKDFTAWSLERPWESPGTVEVGAGADAGQAAYMTFNESFRHDPNHPKFRVANVPVGFAGGLPVGQKPTVGMAGLTLGGGFGFHTRYAGLLCDRLIALEAVNPDTAEIIHATKDNEHRYVTSQPFRPFNPFNPLDKPRHSVPTALTSSKHTQRARVGCVRRRWRQLRGCHEVHVPDDAHLRRPKLHGHPAPALHDADAGAPLVLPRMEFENGTEDHRQPGGCQLDYRDHRRHLDGFSRRIQGSPHHLGPGQDHAVYTGRTARERY